MHAALDRFDDIFGNDGAKMTLRTLSIELMHGERQRIARRMLTVCLTLLSLVACRTIGGNRADSGLGDPDEIGDDSPDICVETCEGSEEAIETCDSVADCETGEMIPESPRQMFEYVNHARRNYQSHEPFDGYPSSGDYVEDRTWEVVMEWDEELAQQAQLEAQRWACDGIPHGNQNSSRSGGESMWLTGLEDEIYSVSARSNPELHSDCYISGQPFECRWHSTGNPHFRMALAYQTGTGSHNHRARLGVGMVSISNCLYWVLMFGE